MCVLCSIDIVCIIIPQAVRFPVVATFSGETSKLLTTALSAKTPPILMVYVVTYCHSFEEPRIFLPAGVSFIQLVFFMFYFYVVFGLP